MEHTQETFDEALTLLNKTLAEFRSGDMTAMEHGVCSDNIEILFSDEIYDNHFFADIYLIADEFHENQIAGFICEDYNDFLRIETSPYMIQSPIQI